MTTFLNMEVSELPNTHKLCYLGDCNFTRSSVAYDYKGDEVAVNQPRFTHRVPDTTVTNLLSGNQSDGGDTLNPELLTLNQRTGTDTELLPLNVVTGTDALETTTGFVGNNATIESSTAEAHSGSRSLKATYASSYYDNVLIGYICQAGVTYTFSVWIKCSTVGTSFRLGNYGGFGSTVQTTGEWQKLTYTFTYNGYTALYIQHIDKVSVVAYIDDCSLTGPEGFTGIGGTPATISSSTEQAHTGTKSLKCVTAGSDTGEGVKVNATKVSNSTVYIAGAWIYAPNGATLEISQYSNDESTPVEVTGTGAWQWAEVSDTTGTTSNEIWIKTKTSAQAITFYVDDLRLGLNVTTGFTAQGSATLSITGEKCYQGHRSLKVVTAGSGGGEGVYMSVVQLSPFAASTLSARVWIPSGVTLMVGISPYATYTGNNSWQLVSQTLTPASSPRNLYFRVSGTVATTFYVDQCMFEYNTSEIHDWAYGGSSYSTYKMEQGCLVEEGHANLLTANQSTCTDTLGDTTGFISGVTISSSTEHYIQGSKSLKVVTSGASGYEGVSTTNLSVSPNVPYTASFWIKGAVGNYIDFIIQERTGADGYVSESHQIHSFSGEWQYITLTRTLGATGGNLRLIIRSLTSPQAMTFYLDMLQVTQTAYPLSWVLGGTTQNAESLTAPSSVLNMGSESRELSIECEAHYSSNLNKVLEDYWQVIWSIEDSWHGDGDGSYLEIMGYASNTPIEIFFDDWNRDDNSYNDISPGFVPVYDNFNKITMGINSTHSDMYSQGAKSGGCSNSTLFEPAQLSIGHWDGFYQFNGIIRNLMVSNIKRDDSDVTARAESELPVVDEYCTMIYPLTKDLSAYKVVER